MFSEFVEYILVVIIGEGIDMISTKFSKEILICLVGKNDGEIISALYGLGDLDNNLFLGSGPSQQEHVGGIAV